MWNTCHHTYFHLGKEKGLFRFQCRVEDCDKIKGFGQTAQKDSLLRHISLKHGIEEWEEAIEFLEDRTEDLVPQYKEMSKELFGTASEVRRF